MANIQALANAEDLSGGESGGGLEYRKAYCNNSYDTNYYRCEKRSTGEICSGPNPPYPC